jgi:hypothetical protein
MRDGIPANEVGSLATILALLTQTLSLSLVAG